MVMHQKRYFAIILYELRETDSGFLVGCPKIATRICACAHF